MKTGLDDFLIDHTIEELRALPTTEFTTLSERIAALPDNADFPTLIQPLITEISSLESESEKALHIARLSDKTGIDKRSLTRDVKKHGEKRTIYLVNENALVAHPSYEVNSHFVSLGFKETVIVNDGAQDRNIYVLVHNGNIALIDKPVAQIGPLKIIFDERDRVLITLNDKWSKKRLKEFVGNPVGPTGLYREVREILTKYIEFQKEPFYGLVAAWIVATYFHRIFYAFPFLNFPGKKQSGKTRTLELLFLLSFNAFKVKGVSIPSLADSIDGQRCTFIMDQAELLSDKRNVELLGILADSYTIGGGKRRIVNITNKSRRVLEFETYAPKAFATTKELDTDLRDRTIEIVMIRAEKEYPYPEAFHPVWAELRDKLYRLLLTKWEEVREIYQNAGPGVTQRVRELWKPIDTILTLEHVDDNERREIRDVFLDAMAETQTGLTELEDRLVQALLSLLPDNGQAILTVTDIVEKMGIPETDSFKKTAQTKWAGKTINRLQLFTRKEGKGDSGRHRYRFEKARIENISNRYRTDGFNGSNGFSQENSQSSDDHQENGNGGNGRGDGSADHQDHQPDSNGSPESVVSDQQNHSTNKTVNFMEDEDFPHEEEDQELNRWNY
ncbi:MAG: hypothetical protein ABSE25_00760 [Syntrophorhabdales bacterium]|jgi:hypothetical protein